MHCLFAITLQFVRQLKCHALRVLIIFVYIHCHDIISIMDWVWPLDLPRWECYLLMLKKYRLSRWLHKLVPYSEWVANIKPNFQVTFAWLKKSGPEINQISLHFVILFASFQLMHLKLSYKLTLCPVLTLPSN